MNVRWFIIVSWLILGFGCSGVRVPKERIARGDKSYEKDLTQLKDYLGDMPVDLVVEGYRPAVDQSVKVVYSDDSVEATIKKAAITQMDPEYTYLRTKEDAVGSTIRIPTKHVTRVSAEGVRTYESYNGPSYGWPIALGILAIIAALQEGKANDGNGCRGGCLAAGLMLGAAALVILAFTLIANWGNEPVKAFEMISKTWMIH
jgi:hypothetical protein